MKPKAGHFMRLSVYYKDQLICQYEGKTAKQLSEISGCSLTRIYACYRRKIGDLKMCNLTYRIQEVCAENSEPQRKCVL